MSRTRVLYEHPLAYAASPVSITYKGRLGEHDLVYFSNLFPAAGAGSSAAAERSAIESQ